MLTHDTAEKKNGRVEIHGVKLTAGKQCIDYMYTGKVNFSLKNPENLIYAAELMQLPSLTDMYFEFLKEKLSAKNCLKYLHLAETFSRRLFAEFFKKSSAQNFANILESDDFSNLSLKLLEQCLSSTPGSGRDTEASKWQAITKWVNSDPKNRKTCFLQLFKMLKLENLPEEFLKNQLLTEPLVKNSTECKEMIWNALLNPAKPKSDDRFDEKSACIIAHQPESRMLMQCELKTKTWSRFARIPADVYRNKLDIISVNGEVYLTSGDAISKFKNGNLVRLRDTGVKPFHPYHQCVLRDTVIYIIYFDQIYKYDTLNNMWNRLAAKLALGEGFFVASSDLFIYAMGGSGTGTFASEFDFRSEKWEPIAAMNNGRCYGAAIWSDERVYALGGSFYMDGWNETEFHIPKGNIWTLVFPVTKCLHCYCKAFYIGGKIYIVGGVNATKSTVSVNYTDRDGVSKTQTSPIMPNVAEIDLKKSTSTEIPSVKIYTGLACGVYTN